MDEPDTFTAADVTRANLAGYFAGLIDMAIVAGAVAVIATVIRG